MSEVQFEEFLLTDTDFKIIETASLYNLNVEVFFKELCETRGLKVIRLPNDMAELEKVIKEKFKFLLDTTLYLDGSIEVVGIPDFFIYNDSLYRFVEVKSESDGIRLSQVRWIKNHHDLKACVTFIIKREVDVMDSSTKPDIDTIMAETEAQKRYYGRIIRTTIEELIRNPDIDTSEGVYLEDIKKEVSVQGITEDELLENLSKMHQNGEVYQPKHEYYRLTK